jgi:hypothetical protein
LSFSLAGININSFSTLIVGGADFRSMFIMSLALSIVFLDATDGRKG